jgi:hypothetical protein
MPKNRISRRVADSDYEYFSPLGAALSRVAVSRDFFRRRIAVIRRPRHATIKRPRSGPRAHTTPSPTTARRTIRRTRVPPCPPSPPPRRTPRPAPPERSGGAPRARAASSPRRDRRKNPFPGSFFDRREGAPASPLGPALSPGPIRPRARRRRPGASRRVQRARRARPRPPRGPRRARSDPPRPRRRGGGPSHPTRRITHVGGAALPTRRRSRRGASGAPSAVGPREDALASRDPRSPPGRAPPLLADAPNHDAPARRSEATGPPDFCAYSPVYAPRPPWVERRFSRAFFLFSFKI